MPKKVFSEFRGSACVATTRSHHQVLVVKIPPTRSRNNVSYFFQISKLSCAKASKSRLIVHFFARIPKPAVFTGGLSRMTLMTHGLPVGLIPKKPPIPLVRDYMIDNRSRRPASTHRVRCKKSDPGLFPFAVIPSLVSIWPEGGDCRSIHPNRLEPRRTGRHGKAPNEKRPLGYPGRRNSSN